MAEIKAPADLPDWFDIDQYDFKPTSEQEMHGAALAVLDRLPFNQTVTAPSFDSKNVGNAERNAALIALEEWAVGPYRRITGQWRGALQVALQPSVTDDEIIAFAGIIEREVAEDAAACQQALDDIVESVSHLPAKEKLLKVQKKVQELLEPGEEEKGRTSPVSHHWVRKLFDYHIAAYLDLTLWAALAGHNIDIETLHSELLPDGHDPRSVADMLRGLHGERHLSYRTRIEEGGAFDALQKALKRR